MWTMTQRGFFSAVQHNDDATLLVVRTRDNADAQHLRDWYAQWVTDLEDIAPFTQTLPPAEVIQYPHADYPWRVILPRTAYAAFMAEAVEDLDYGNFKDAVKDAQGPDRAQVYGSVWGVLLRLEDLDPLGRRFPEDDAWSPEDMAPWGVDG